MLSCAIKDGERLHKSRGEVSSGKLRRGKDAPAWVQVRWASGQPLPQSRQRQCRGAGDLRESGCGVWRRLQPAQLSGWGRGVLCGMCPCLEPVGTSARNLGASAFPRLPRDSAQRPHSVFLQSCQAKGIWTESSFQPRCFWNKKTDSSLPTDSAD